ncbi:MJ1255/VC2487 family glycosyltransferase [Candidatus Pelagadaptatus aseana]|uniref:MJ1255/VC2487 family glycosyltransferase n=1 Tax=Candidatus Pelagadaptatus aseana TaxID=3120508 RepID=UPI003C6FFC3F
MKILYGVQGTGNGHITRARTMAKAFEKFAVEVDWVFTGRPQSDYFDMECFGNYRTLQGLTYVSEKGSIKPWKTARQLNLRQFFKDVAGLDLSAYDLVISDFEPVTAWAARRQGKRSLGLSHQCAFHYDIPKRGNNFFTDLIMKWFAPVDLPVGVHWGHFNGRILPPMIEQDHGDGEAVVDNHYLVYFPFQTLDFLISLVEPFSDHHFFIYHSVDEPIDIGHIHVRPFSRAGFQNDLQRVAGVICGGGFELPSESISLGKKLLVQPVHGQLEQLSNGLALQQLGLATVCDTFDHAVLRDWLANGQASRVVYPDVSAALVEWLQQGNFNSDNGNNMDELVWRLWRESGAVPGWAEDQADLNRVLA